MKEIAEFVGRGHPDRLCDQIVERCVELAVKLDEMAVCQLECAVHQDIVFLDGRIAAGKNNTITVDDLSDIVKNVFKDAGYNYQYKPHPNDLKINIHVILEPLSDYERSSRNVSDDQNVVVGYAINNEKTNYVPIAHYIANFIGIHLTYKDNLYYGKDIKVLVQLDFKNNIYTYDRITINAWKSKNINMLVYKTYIIKLIDSILNQLPYEFGLNKIDHNKLFINGCADNIGGTNGDNGLSGKKLVIDFYGPSIPIGGGAICGKDHHKVDVCGAFRARQLALYLVKKKKYHSVLVRLGFSPGERTPYFIDIVAQDSLGMKYVVFEEDIPDIEWFSIEQICKDIDFVNMKRACKLLFGYMNDREIK